MDNIEIMDVLNYLEALEPTVDQQSYIDGIKAALMVADGVLTWDEAFEPVDGLLVQMKNEIKDEHAEYERNII